MLNDLVGSRNSRLEISIFVPEEQVTVQQMLGDTKTAIDRTGSLPGRLGVERSRYVEGATWAHTDVCRLREAIGYCLHKGKFITAHKRLPGTSARSPEGAHVPRA